MSEKRYILTKEIAQKKLLRMAYEIVERNSGEDELVLAGIRENGYLMAGMIQHLLKPLFNGKVDLIAIKIDKKNPHSISVQPEVDLNNKIVILVDDVANSGRTILFAIKPFLEFYPKKIQTLVLVERTHKLFPVTSDYVGLSISTTLQEQIIVEIKDGDIQGAFLQ